MPILLVSVLALALIAWLIWQPRLAARRRQRVATEPFPPAWRAIIRRRVPLAARLPATLQAQLRQHIQVFLAETPFIGCQGMVIDDEVRVTIAAQACLLLLNQPRGRFAWLRQVLVYPSAFAVDVSHVDPAGVVQSGRDWRAGESWQEGLVVLSWEDVLVGAADPGDGWNVVIHEFAHQLDAWAGVSAQAVEPEEAIGPDVIEPGGKWTPAMQAEYEALVQQAQRLEASELSNAALEPDGAARGPFLDPYGATDAAEFFAVVTEAFFEQGRALADEHPALFADFHRLYGLDTRGW